MITNYYHILKIDRSATSYDVKKAFRREIKIYHPDNNSSPEAKAHFEKLVEAFEILSDDARRYHYNQMLDKKATNELIAIEQESQYKEWQTEAKKKSEKYERLGLDDLFVLDTFNTVDADITDSLISGTEDIVDGLTEGLGDIFDLF